MLRQTFERLGRDVANLRIITQAQQTLNWVYQEVLNKAYEQFSMTILKKLERLSSIHHIHLNKFLILHCRLE
jgi:hypothetical protein